jgi:hypothetical protein
MNFQNAIDLLRCDISAELPVIIHNISNLAHKLAEFNKI